MAKEVPRDKPRGQTPGYLRYVSLVKEALPSKIFPDELLSLITQYNQPKFIENLRPLIFLDPSDQLFTATQMAKWAVEQTNLIIPYRGNVHQDIERSQGLARARSEHIRGQLHRLAKKNGDLHGIFKMTTEFYEKILSDLNVPKEDIKEMAHRIAETLYRSLYAIRHGGGNCHEYASVTLQCLLQLKKCFAAEFNQCISSIDIKKSNNPEHVFMALSVGKDSTILICDAWGSFVGSLEDSYKHRIVDNTGHMIYDTLMSDNLVSNQALCALYQHNFPELQMDVFTYLERLNEGAFDDAFARALANDNGPSVAMQDEQRKLAAVFGQCQPQACSNINRDGVTLNSQPFIHIAPVTEKPQATAGGDKPDNDKPPGCCTVM